MTGFLLVMLLQLEIPILLLSVRNGTYLPSGYLGRGLLHLCRAAEIWMLVEQKLLVVLKDAAKPGVGPWP